MSSRVLKQSDLARKKALPTGMMLSAPFFLRGQTLQYSTYCPEKLFLIFNKHSRKKCFSSSEKPL